MSGKVASFLLSLALIAWQVLDIVKGKAGVLTWVLLGIFSASGEMMEIGVPAFRIIGITLIISGGASLESSIRPRQSAFWADRQALWACRLVTS